MGAHKQNPTAIAAKEGKLPPKKKTASYAETVRILRGPLAAEMAMLIFAEERSENDTRTAEEQSRYFPRGEKRLAMT